MMNHKPKIAIFDYVVHPNSPMGGCQLRMLEGLCDKYDFTVFAVEFANPRPDRIAFVRIPAPTRPTIVLSLVFHLLTPLFYMWHRFRHKVKFDLVERNETFTCLGTISYVHFCHRAYLHEHWKTSRQRGLRGALLALDHFVRAFVFEPLLYRSARRLVAPSRGLERELLLHYPFTRNKIVVLPNSADTNRLGTPTSEYCRSRFREQIGVKADDIVLIFIAGGQFERKGLPQLISAIQLVNDKSVKLIVVGGSSHWLAVYRAKCAELGMGEQILFQGAQRDVAPYLWAADAFTLPSQYEVFPLVSLEAAAAGLPLIVTRISGTEEFVEDGVNGFFVAHEPEPIAAGIRRFLDLHPEERRCMGRAAQTSAQHYSIEAFQQNWDRFLTAELQLG